MSIVVCGGATLQCSFGTAPSTLQVLPKNKVLTGQAAANIMDNKPMMNIMPFGMCTSMANPRVAAATATPPPGVLKPQPCIPVIPGPWAPGSPTVLIANLPALNNTSKLMCSFGGVIQVVNPGQMKTMVP